MKKSQKTLLSSILAIFICIASFWIFYEGVEAYRLWTRQPLGASLRYSATSGAPVPEGTLATLIVASAETQAPSSSTCADVPTMMILGIGSDARSDDYRYGRADVIRAIRVDFVAETVTVLAFPRDLWVEIPEINDELGTSYQKLNTAYFFGNPGLHYWDHPSEGPGLLALTLERNFGLETDHYLAASMDVFVDAVDALGGLDFYFPEVVDGRSTYDRSARLVFQAGDQHLNGEQSLTLARMRNVSTFMRSTHQNLVMCTLEEKIKSPEVLPRIPALISAFTDNIQTDLTPLQISQLACLGTQMPTSNIIFASFPEGMFSGTTTYDPVAGGNTFIWDADYDLLREYVDQFQAGTWPVLASDTSSSSAESTDAGSSSRCE